MAENIATLGIKVTSSGVKETSENLEKVSKSSEKAQKAIDKLLESYKQQEVKARSGKAGLAEYRLSLLGATEAEKKFAVETIKATEKINEANKAAKAHEDTLKSLISRLYALGAAYFGIQAIKGFASDLLETAKIADSYKYSLQAVSDSNEQAGETYEYLRKESDRLGLSLVSQEKAFTGFAAAAKQSGMKVEETRSVYTGLMEAMTAIHRTPEEASQALKAFQDMLSKGTIQAEELKKQLGNSLPGAMAYMSEATGKLTKDLMKMMEQGIFPAREGVKILSDYLSNKFQVAAENASNSVQGSINKMENAWYELKKAIVDAMGDNTTGIISNATKKIKQFTEELSSPEAQKALKQFSEDIIVIADALISATTATASFLRKVAELRNKELFDAGEFGNPIEVFLKGVEASKKGLIDFSTFFKASTSERIKILSEIKKKEDDYTASQVAAMKAVREGDNEKVKGIKRVSDAQVESNKKAFTEKGAAEGQAKAIQKIIDKIKEKSVVAGMSSEQGLIAQLKEAGANEEVIKAQQKIIDGIEAKDKAYKDSIKGQREVESEEKKRVKFIEDYIAKLEQEADTYKKGKEYTADYVLSLKDATEAQKQRAKTAGAFIDAAKRQDAAEKKNKKNLEDYAALMKKVMPEFERDELSRQQSLELTATIFRDKLTPAMLGTAAALHLFDEQSESVKNINEYFDTKEIDDFTKKTDELKDKLKFEGTSFGNEIADGINNAVISMQKFNDQLDKQKIIQKDIDKLEKEIKATNDLDLKAKKQKEMDNMTQEGIKGQLSAYRQLFGTTSQLFKENSKERKALHTLEMAFAAAEIAMNLQKTISAAYTAIATQGTGDPYSAFARIAAMTALMGGIVAAAGGSLGGGGTASAPTAVSGGSSQSTALGSNEQSQSITNAFNFLEDIESGQYDELKDISSSMKDLNKNITGLVTSIVRTGGVKDFASVTGINGGTSLTQDVAVKYGLSLGTAVVSDIAASITKNIPIIGNIYSGLTGFIDDITSSISGAIFGGSKKTSILASGLQITPGTIGSGEVLAQAYADIKVKKSGGLFGSDKTYFKTLTDDVDQSVQDMITVVFKNMGNTILNIAKGLGTENLQEVFDYVFDIGKIDLKGLDTEGINKALQEAFSTASDKAASDLFGQLIGQYQKIGEGLLETAVRLVGEKAAVFNVLELTGQGFEGSNIPAKALEVTQALIDIAGGLDNLADAATTYYDKFFTDAEKQTRLQNQLNNSFEALNLKLPTTRAGYRAIIESLDLTTEAGQRTYVTLLGLSEGADKYYTTIEEGSKKTTDAIKAEEDLAKARKEAVSKTEKSLTVDLLNAQGKSQEAINLQRQIELESIDESLRPMKLRIWQLQDEAAASEKATKEAEEAKKAIEEAAKARKAELETLIRNTVQSQIDGYQKIADAANEALSKAEGLLTRSFEAEKKRITTVHEAIIEGLTKNLDDAKISADELRSAFEGLGSARKAMVLAGTEQLSYNTAQSQLFSALGLARTGDFSGAKAVAADTSALTQDTKGFYSSFEDYQREFFKTKNAITELESLTGDALDVQETMVSILQSQIDLENSHFDDQMQLLDDQLDAIMGVDKSVVSLTEAITQYQEAQYAADGANTLLKTQTEYLNTMMNTLFDTNSKTGNLVTLVDEYTHPEKYPTQTKITTITSPEEQKETNEDLIRQIKILTDTVERGNYANAKSNLKTATVLNKWDKDGLPATTV